ncbi:MAG TPA: hypothetical protein VH538_06850 [Gaiellaceae bacterium]
MHKHASRTLVALLVSVCAVFGLVAATARESAHGAQQVVPSCQLANGIKHVIYLQFDNVHYKQDVSNVQSDIQQMPNLVDFLTNNGTLFTNDHTVLISHTSDGILSSLTGLYGDRNGATVGNSYGFFEPDGSVGFSSTFKYWTDVVDAANDPKPSMITDGGKNTPAPWVPFTRDGCDVGGVGTANIELENTATNASGDMTRVFGENSPEWLEAKSNPQKALTDFVGIAIHCGNAPTSKCANDTNAKPDLLPDEPGGYSGFNALYGATYVDPAITGGNACVNATNGNPIEDPDGNCGFPGFDGMEAWNTLGYVEQMQENGVPVTYGYLSDVHDCHTPNTTSDSVVSTAQGPGESCAEQQIADYNTAFGAFFSNLAAHGIDKSNTLFVITVDEGDHFTGGAGIPQSDGTLAYSHTNCTDLTACPSNQIGEVNINLPPLLPSSDPGFQVHSDSAPTVYVNGNPAANDPSNRKLQRDLGSLQAPDPYNGNGQQTSVTYQMADPVEEAALHMVNADPARTPSFTDFGQDDFFFSASTTNPNPSCGANPCVAPGFAWNHGDVQQQIADTWAGMVGPGVAANGVDGTTWTDHTNLRPTIMALTGLKDDYTQDGVVLTQGLSSSALNPALAGQESLVQKLGQLYEQLNAPFGEFGTDTLAASTRAIESDTPGDASYVVTDAVIKTLTAQRNALADQIHAALQNAEFSGQPINPVQAALWQLRGALLLGIVQRIGAPIR